jgi:hypothetical protein
MNAMAPTRQTELQARRVRLTTGPAAAARARNQVRAAIGLLRVLIARRLEVLVWNHDLLPAVTGGFAPGCGPQWRG